MGLHAAEICAFLLLLETVLLEPVPHLSVNILPSHKQQEKTYLMLWIAMNPVVSIGLKLSNVSMLASSSEYSFSVLLLLPNT